MPDPFGIQQFGQLGRKPPKKEEPPPMNRFGEFWIKLLASGCYVGYVPVAPGTWGSLLGLLIWSRLNRIPIDPLGKFLILGMAVLVAVWICYLAEKVYNRGDANTIVIDEILGMLISASYLTPGTYDNEIRLLLVTFVIFRFLDIVKPFPLRQLEQLPHGWGVMMDDVAAGLITLCIMGLPPLHALWVGLLDLHVVKAAGGS